MNQPKNVAKASFKNHMNVREGDTVVVIAGKQKPRMKSGSKQYTTGKVTKAFPKTQKVIVEGVAVATVHQKPRGQGMQGGIIHREMPIHVSNVMVMCPQCNKPTRVGHKLIESSEGKSRKVRVCRRKLETGLCGAVLDD